MSVEIIGFDDCDPLLDWVELTRAIEAGHNLARAEVADTFLRREGDTMLTRNAWIDGLGLLVKTATIFPENVEVPSINGGVSLYSDRTGELEAVVDFHLVTKWKTAADSLLGALKLARRDSETILIVGAGTVAGTLYDAYRAAFPNAQFLVWNRTEAKARAFAGTRENITAVADLADGVSGADIITSATMSTEPILRGEWLRAGQHVDLIGAYRGDMREADDTALQRSRIFVDSRETTIGHIGEIQNPLDRGVIGENDILADYYDLTSGAFARGSGDEITLFKNGGGAHLDLMTADYIMRKWAAR